jgi:hypothetical protein
MSAEGREVRAGGATLEGLLVRWRADMQPKEFSLSKAELMHWFSLCSRTVQGTGLARVCAELCYACFVLLIQRGGWVRQRSRRGCSDGGCS